MVSLRLAEMLDKNHRANHYNRDANRNRHLHGYQDSHASDALTGLADPQADFEDS
jgi:hypothetical protein